MVNRTRRKLIPSELLKENAVANPISHHILDINICLKEWGKLTTKLFRNMIKQESLLAKRKSRENSLSSSISTRSNHNTLR